MYRFFTKLILGKVPQNYSLESNWRAGFVNFKKEKYQNYENLNKMSCTILKGNLEKFLKIQENLNFLQKFENLKVLQAEFQAILSNLAF